MTGIHGENIDEEESHWQFLRNVLAIGLAAVPSDVKNVHVMKVRGEARLV